MAFEFRPNFFTGNAKPAASLPEIQFTNDPKFRAIFGEWLSENFDTLTAEYQKHRRFLSLAEIEDSPLQ